MQRKNLPPPNKLGPQQRSATNQGFFRYKLIESCNNLSHQNIEFRNFSNQPKLFTLRNPPNFFPTNIHTKFFHQPKLSESDTFPTKNNKTTHPQIHKRLQVCQSPIHSQGWLTKQDPKIWVKPGFFFPLIQGQIYNPPGSKAQSPSTGLQCPEHRCGRTTDLAPGFPVSGSFRQRCPSRGKNQDAVRSAWRCAPPGW